MSAEPAALRLDVLETVAEWGLLEPEWRALFAASPVATPPLAWGWCRLWWEHYGDTCGRGGGLRLVSVRRHDRLVGLAPLYLNRQPHGTGRHRWLGFLGSGSARPEDVTPQYQGLLHAPGEGEACAAAVAGWLFGRGGPRWDELDLGLAAASAPHLAWRAGRSRTALTRHFVARPAQLDGGFDAWLGRLAYATRKRMRQLLRGVEQAQAPFAVASTAAEAAAMFDQLVAVHQARWAAVGQPGSFRSARKRTFYRQLVARGVPAGEAVVARLGSADRPLALLCGLRAHDTFHLLQMGVAPGRAVGLASPGLAANVLLLRHLGERGVGVYDTLVGDSLYKRQLATGGPTALTWLRLFAPSLGGAGAAAAVAAAAVSRRLVARRGGHGR